MDFASRLEIYDRHIHNFFVKIQYNTVFDTNSKNYTAINLSVDT